MGKHSKYSPSKLSRILKCTASAQYEDTAGSSSYADRGTMLHGVMENIIDAFLDGRNYERYLTPLESIDRIEVENAFDYSIGLITPDSTVHLEKRVSITKDCYGTADMIVTGGGRVHVCDFKFGSVEVSAEDNVQLMAYASGVCNMLNLYSGLVRLHIIQPKINNYSEFVTTVQEIYEWRDETLIPTLDKINRGEVEYSPSMEACRWCPNKGACSARIEQAFKNAESVFADYAILPDLPVDRFADLLAMAKEIEQVIADVKAHATVLLKKGEEVKGLKLVAGRSSRHWKDEKEAEKLLNGLLGDSAYKVQLVTPPQAEKLLTKEARRKGVLDDLVDKVPGKPTLVPEGDKREALGNIAEATFAKYAD